MRSDPTALAHLVTVARQGVTVTSDPGLLAEARRRFDDTQAIVLQHVLAADLLTWVQTRVSGQSFDERIHPASGVEACMPDNEAVRLLRFHLQSPEWLRFCESITGAGPLDDAVVRIYRLVAGAGHHHDWHDDFSHRRCLGLSLNLSDAEFEGGQLQVRTESTGVVTADVKNTGAGDMVIFKLGDDVEHRVLPVTGTTSRTALAGWLVGGTAPTPQVVIA